MKKTTLFVAIVCLVATMFSSCKKDTIACFSASDQVVTVGETVTFTSCAVNQGDYAWTFGDGNASNDENPTHTYTRPGTYVVTMKVLAKKGSRKSDETTVVITVVPANEGADANYFTNVTEDYKYEWNTDADASNYTMTLYPTFSNDGNHILLSLPGMNNTIEADLNGNDFSFAAVDSLHDGGSPKVFGGLTGSFSEDGNTISLNYSYSDTIYGGSLDYYNSSISGYRLY